MNSNYVKKCNPKHLLGQTTILLYQKSFFNMRILLKIYLKLEALYLKLKPNDLIQR